MTKNYLIPARTLYHITFANEAHSIQRLQLFENPGALAYNTSRRHIIILV